MSPLSRRRFLQTVSAGALTPFYALAAPELGRVKIADIKVMVLQGPRTYTLVKVLTDSGVFGIGEAYGNPGIGIKDGVLELRSYFIGKDPLEIEKLYNGLGPRTDGSSHMLLRAVSGIEMALWDIAGKLIGLPVVTLLGGNYRDSMRVYHEEGPRNMFDRASCTEWADRMKAHPAGWTAFKISPPRSSPQIDRARDTSNRILTDKELRDIRIGFESCRNAIGSDYDLICRCFGDYDLPSAIKLAEAIEPSKPLWLEDPLPPDYSPSWARLAAASKVSIAPGEHVARRQGFKDFIINQGCDIVQLDVRNTGGLLESKKVADLADIYYLPTAARNSGSAVCTLATAHLAGAVRDFMASETIVGMGNWMDDVILHDGPIVKEGKIAVPMKPGLGIELNKDVVKANLAQGEKYWD